MPLVQPILPKHQPSGRDHQAPTTTATTNTTTGPHQHTSAQHTSAQHATNQRTTATSQLTREQGDVAM